MDTKEPSYIEGIGWRYETEHSMLRRMNDHDYQSRCIYMFTLTLADRSQPLLGCLAIDDEGTPRLLPSPLGRRVAGEWLALSHEYPQVDVMRLQLMEDYACGLVLLLILIKTRTTIRGNAAKQQAACRIYNTFFDLRKFYIFKLP